MTIRELQDFKNMLVGVQMRICGIALQIHKEQERVENLINILNTALLKKEDACQ